MISNNFGEDLTMRIEKCVFARKFTVGCTGDRNNIGSNNGNYEEYIYLEITRIGSNTYGVEELQYNSGTGDMFKWEDMDMYRVKGKKAVRELINEHYQLEYSYLYGEEA